MDSDGSPMTCRYGNGRTAVCDLRTLSRIYIFLAHCFRDSDGLRSTHKFVQNIDNGIMKYMMDAW